VDWQWIAVLACVLLAAAYVARRAWRTWHPKPGSCGGGCGSGCAAPKSHESSEAFISADQLTLRRRQQANRQ
jgi:FeoB-associated Cys-rich membrane protein